MEINYLVNDHTILIESFMNIWFIFFILRLTRGNLLNIEISPLIN